MTDEIRRCSCSFVLRPLEWEMREGMATYICEGCGDLWVDSEGDGVLNLVHVPTIEDRVAAIEARQRANGMHDPHCKLLQRNQAQRNSMMYLVPPPCNCWLAEEI